MKQIISFEKEIPFKTMIGEITSISLEHTLTFQEDSSIGGDFIVSGTYKMTEASRLDEPFSYKIPVDIVLTTSLDEEDRLVDIENFTYEILDEEALLVHIDLKVEGREKIEPLEEELEEDFKEEIDSNQQVEKTSSSETIEAKELLEEREDQEEIKVLKERERVIEKIEEDDFEEEVLKAQEEVRQLEEAPLLVEEKTETLDERDDDDDEGEELSVEEVLTTEQSLSMEEESLMNAQESLSKIHEDTLSSEKKSEDTLVKEETSKEVMHSIFSVFKDTEETFSTYSVYILREEDTLDDVLSRYKVTKEEAGEYNHLEELKVGSKLILPTVISNE